MLVLAGGAATFCTARLVGRLADARGKVFTSRLIALCTILPLFVQTHLGPVPLWLMVAFSTLFFILVPGRMVPAMAIVTSAAQPRLRGPFLAMVGSVQQLAAGMATYLGGLIIADAGPDRALRLGGVSGDCHHARGVGFVGLLRCAPARRSAPICEQGVR